MINHTKIGLKEHLALNRVIFREKSLPLVIFYNIIPLFGFIYGLCISNHLLIFFMAVLFVLLPLLSIVINKVETKKIWDKYCSMYEESDFTYIFKEEGVLIIYRFHDDEDTAFYNYSDLIITETKEHLFLFFGSRKAFVLKKEGFENGYDNFEFKNLVGEKVKKYKIREKK